ncbi:MAG: hypothetical protein D3916_05770 [Candidatus Electrothrix sp. MAN1_4]|nr:hypothetical protein [Candidatus Electrothrix sp. MAN1_4]
MNEYIARIENRIQSCFLMFAYQLNIDKKAQDLAFITGQIDFIDGSTLDFKEFVEKGDNGIEKYKYGYNYRKNSGLLFRYDNAPDPGARQLESFPHHKHTADGRVIESHEAEFEEVLKEIMDYIQENWEH